MENKKQIHCPKCNHEWETKSQLIYVTCPSCQRKFEKDKGTAEVSNDELQGIEVIKEETI